MLRIDHLLERRPRELSGGEQQRVALGRAIIRTPNVLLLDEPLSNLDAKLRTIMRGELVKLQRRIGCTTVFVTHDQLEAMTMSDRIAVMNGGRLQQFATPAEIYDRPANKFVAGFIGSPPMNFISGKLTRQNGKLAFTGPDIDMPLAGTAKDGHDISLGVRPENISFDSASGDIPAVVTLVELIGAEKYIFLDTPAGPLISRQDADNQAQVDDKLFCRFDTNKLRFFAEREGEAISLAGTSIR
jgi:multiple sugar transport system ATP-binding protein